MNPLALVFSLILVVAQFRVPRRLVFLPMLLAACHIPYQQGIDLGIKLTAIRLLIIAGIFRAKQEGKFAWSRHQPLDVLMAFWAIWAVISSFFLPADEHFNPITVNGSLAFDYLGVYLFSRAFFQTRSDLLNFAHCLAIVLIPLAALLCVEKLTASNPYAALGTFLADSWIRGGKVRAAGPFGNAILAGTIGGSAIPLLLLSVRPYSRVIVAGLIASVIIVFCSASSGPLMTMFAALGAMALWRWRNFMPHIKVAVVLGIIGLAAVMNDPVWYIIARIDLAGGSTGWHRAELITRAIDHLSEWWMAGTTNTRHWMPYGIQWSSSNSDITNEFISMGVRGGLLLMLSYAGLIFKFFGMLGRAMKVVKGDNIHAEFMYWCMGAAMFSHCASFMGIAYFDQSRVFLCLLLGAAPGVTAAAYELLSTPSSIKADDAQPSLTHA